MSGIVKASSVSLSPAMLRMAGGKPVPDTQPLAAQLEDPTVALSARIEALEQQLRVQHEHSQRQELEAYQKGRKEGAEQAVRELKKQWDREADTIARAAQAAQDAFEARLAQLEALSLELAQAALACVLGDSERHAELLAQTIAHHLRGIQRSVVRIAVSQRDFPAEAARELLAGLPDGLRDLIDVRTDLPAGACHVDLALGHADLGLPSQQERLARTFAALTTHE